LHNHHLKLFTIHGTDAIVSTLFTTVGFAHNPETAGNGGLIRGFPLSPLMIRSKQFPLHKCKHLHNEHKVQDQNQNQIYIFPKKPAAFASAILF
jgi:hypothetical protein